MTLQPHTVVTGSSGGIGHAVCELLIERGHVVTGLDKVVLPQAAWQQIEVDLSREGAAFDAAQTARRIGPVTQLVHCAAVQVLGGAGEAPPHEWLASLRVNLLAIEEVLRATLDDLRAHGGAVAVVSSVHATASTRGMAVYATTKAALHGWVRAAALDLAPQVRVNAVQPGAVRTEMLLSGLARRPEDGSPEDALNLIARKTPLGVVAEPHDVAEVVVALLTPSMNRFMTGAFIAVDGGALLRLGTE